MQTWQIGDVKLTKVLEIELTGPVTWLLPDATAENLRQEKWLQPHFADADGQASMSIHALVIESEDRRILVDTCVGNDKQRSISGWSMRDGPFLEDLAGAGFSTDSIDTVLCTHLHVDHVGWNTRLANGRWVPTFPKARYLFNETEYRYWETEEDETYGDVFGDSVKPIFDAGLVDFVPADHVLTRDVRLEPTPGHTPGHVSVRISSQGEEAVITGDLMHHPVQCAKPEWGSVADVDPAQALATRRAFLERCGDAPVLVVGTHFAGPTAGHIVRKGAAFRFEA
jgi:glyoxylase-like metal-dependent hydrolase (beta-lactamase superfamily II)